jgi:hypothetical protein
MIRAKPGSYPEEINSCTIVRNSKSDFGSTESFRLRKRVVTWATSTGSEWMAIFSEDEFPVRTDLGRKVIPIPVETQPMIVSMVLNSIILYGIPSQMMGRYHQDQFQIEKRTIVSKSNKIQQVTAVQSKFTGQ